MGYHSSTRERLPILEQFYARALADIPPARVVLDLACGLNPLALAWMPLGEAIAAPDGYMRVPQGPGLGIDVDENILARYAVT